MLSEGSGPWFSCCTRYACTGVDCNDPIGPYKGTHAYPYISQVWAYDAVDLLAVKRGQKKSWEIKPYATWPIDTPFASAWGKLTGAAYDAATQRIFVAAMHNDGMYPLIHVFKVVAGSSPRNPSPPSNVQIVR